MYKQCRLRIGNTYTYKWVHEKKAKEGEIITVKDKILKDGKWISRRQKDWEIDTIWHLKQAKKYLAERHRVN